MVIIIGLLLILLGLAALALQRLYSCVPAYELKRLAARGDHLAATLYRPVAFGASLRLLLWLAYGGFSAAGLALLANGGAGWATFLAAMFVLFASAGLLSLRLGVHSVRAAAWTAPVLHKVLQHAHRPLSFAVRFANRWRQTGAHSGLYETADLVRLLHQQRQQHDNRVPGRILSFLEQAAGLDEAKAAGVVLPWNEVKLVNADERIGPVLLDELHASRQGVFPVYKSRRNNIVGVISLHDAAAHVKETARVRDLMKPNIGYVHEGFSLKQVLDVLADRGQTLAVAVNEFEETVGVITLRRVIEKLAGEITQIDLPFDDKKAVASWRSAPQLAEEPVVADEMPEPPSSEQTEVVE